MSKNNKTKSNSDNEKENKNFSKFSLSDPLTEGVDFYFNEDGLMVLTREYLLKRGFCCDNRCKHCPY